MTSARFIRDWFWVMLVSATLAGCYVPEHVPYGGEKVRGNAQVSHGTAPLEQGATQGDETTAPEKAPTPAQPPSQARPAAPAVAPSASSAPGAGASGAPATAPAAGKASLSKFFGRTVRASHVAYVIDRSGNTAQYWPVLSKELFVSIGDTWQDQDFVVVLMGDPKPILTPANGLAPGNKENQGKAMRKILDTEPTGKTDPMEALKVAMGALAAADSKPGKVIYFVTDRPFLDKGMPELLEVLNRDGSVQVMTYVVGKATIETADTLAKAAKQNGGKFTRIAGKAD
jgi:hypothetical protein